jgi:hypothetical protein
MEPFKLSPKMRARFANERDADLYEQYKNALLNEEAHSQNYFYEPFPSDPKRDRELIEFKWKEMQHREKGKRMIKTLLLWIGLCAFVGGVAWWLHGVWTHGVGW